MSVKHLAVLACGAALLVPALAPAATFNLAYGFAGGELLTARIEGTVQPDGDTILVSDVSSIVFDGQSLPAPTLIDSAEEVARGDLIDRAPLLSLSGALFDLVACSDSGLPLGFCDIGFAFTPALDDLPDQVIAGDGDPTLDETFAVERYSLSVVPLPPTLPLMLGALAAAGIVARRRACRA